MARADAGDGPVTLWSATPGIAAVRETPAGGAQVVTPASIALERLTARPHVASATLTAVPSHDRTAQTLDLPDGRLLGYAEWGRSDGQPMIGLHGIPSSRLDSEHLDGVARDLGIRLLAIDRPGVGLSDRQPGRRVVDIAADVGAFADSLGIERFAVVGGSGGSPYALACGTRLVERIPIVGVLSGVGPARTRAQRADYATVDRMLLVLSRHAPALARASLALARTFTEQDPRRALRSFERDLTPTDRAVITTWGSPPVVMAAFVESLRRGTAGVVDDYRAWAGDWGFALEDVVTPVRLWHGADDTLVAVRQAHEMAARIEGAKLTVHPGEGHLMFFEHAREILGELAAGVSLGV